MSKRHEELCKNIQEMSDNNPMASASDLYLASQLSVQIAIHELLCDLRGAVERINIHLQTTGEE